MSLVVARCIQDEIRIVSDTLFADSQATHRTNFDGGLKCIVISPTCCICFAGNTVVAEEAIAPILICPGGGRNQIASHLLDRHVRSGGQTDFLLAFADAQVELSKIADGDLLAAIPSAWIGDNSAFSSYQASYHATPLVSDGVVIEPERFAIAAKMDDALKEVIEDHAHQTVGDFLVTVTSKPAEGDGFRYLARAAGYDFKTVSNTVEPTSVLQSLGPESGSYRYSLIVPKKPGIGAIAIYIHEGRVGTVFHPKSNWIPKVFSNTAIDQFLTDATEQFGVEFDGLRWS